MTARWLASIKLVAALLIVVGLAVSVPPSFEAVDGDHFGLLLHPLFPHVHAGATPAATLAELRSAVDEAESVASSDVRPVDQSPGIRGQAADEGFRLSLSGIVLPMILVAIFLHLKQISAGSARLADQHWRAPPAPPPRWPAPVVFS